MKKYVHIFSFLSLITFVQVCFGQTTVFTDNFNRATLSPGGTPSMTYTNALIGTSTATTNSSTNLRITNGTTSGISYVSGSTSTFSTPYNTILHSNVGGIITWLFNFKYNRTTNPDGIASGSYGTAIVLAGSSSNLTTGTGYAIIYGQSGATDPIRLVRYSNGVGTSTDIISSGVNDISNFTNYVSVKVTYYPSSNNWSLYIRDDGASAWADPSTGVTNQIGSTTTDATYTASALTAFGFVWSHANTALASNCTDFENFKVLPPPIISVSTNSLTFGNVVAGTSSAEQSYTVSGHYLVDNIVISTSQPYLEISQTSGSGFSTGPITLAQSGGVVGATTIYARWSPLAINNATQYAFINNTSTSATTQILDCSGKGVGVNLYGNVYNDLDGSSGSNKVDGTGIGSPGGTQLYATLVQGGVTVLSTAVDPTGVYYFMNQALGNYTVLISTTNYAIGSINPTPSLPSGWTFNGEIDNDTNNSLTGNTPPTDGVLSISVTTYDSNINFGIVQPVSPPTVTPGGPDIACQSATPTPITLSGASVGGSATTGAWSISSPTGIGTLSSTTQTASPSTVTYTPAANFNGTVILTLTSNGSPIATGTRTITVNPLPTVAAITGTSTVCVGSTTQLFDTTVGGVWSSGSTNIALINASGVVTGVSPGTSLITYTFNGPACPNSVTQLVQVNPLPTANAGGPNSVCQSATPVAITLSGASIGGGATTGAWSIISGGGSLSSTAQTANPETITYTPAANYSGPATLRLTSNNPNSCGIATSDRTITINPLPTVAAITGTAAVCVGSTTQLADATSFGSWSSGSPLIATVSAGGVGGPGGLVTGVSPGTALITYTINNGTCTTSVTQLVTVNPLPTANAGGPSSTCQSATPTAITLSGASIGGGATTGAWSIISGGGNLSSTAQTANPETITYTPAANYSGPVILRLTSNNPNSCGIATSERTITVNPLPVVAAITGTAAVCVGSTTQLADATSFGSWSSGSPLIATVSAGGVGGPGGLVTGVSAGTALITYTVNGPACSNSVTQLVTVNPLPTANASGPNSVCQSATPVAITLSGASIGGGATTGAWSIISGGGSLSSTAQTANPETITYTPAANYSGPVTLRLTSNNPNSCGIATSERTITVNPLPTVAAITGTATVCVGSTTQLADATSFGSWSSGSPLIATVSAGGVGGPGGLVTGVSPGTALITYTINNGTCTNSVTQLVTVNPLLTANAGGPSSTCQSATPTAITLSGTSIGGGATTGAWSIISGGGNLSSTAQTANPETITYTPAANYSGPVILRLTSNNPNSCGIATSDRTITVNPLPTVAAITGTSTVCVGSTTQLADATVGGVWSSGSTNIALINAFGVVTGVSPGTSLITYTINGPACPNSVTQLVTVNPLPTANAGGPNSACQSAIPVAITLSGASIGGGATSGAWSIISGGGSLSSTAQTANPETITYTPATNYSGLVTLRLTSNNPNSCGIATSDRTITVNPLPTVAAITGTSTVCVGSTTQLADATGGGFWSSGSTNIALINVSGVVTGVSTGTSVISYSVSNMNGCTNIVSLLITVIALPTIPVTSVMQPTCSVATGTITVTIQNASDSYSFDNGVSFQVSNIKSSLVAGSYNVIIKSIGGCNSVVSSATINALPTTPATPIVGAITQPTCTLATGSVVLSGLPSGNWTINPGNISGSTTSTTISGLAAGTYNFTVTNSVGCVSVATANVVINSQPSTPTIPVTSVTQPTCSVATGTITVTVQNASDSYSFDNGVSFQASNVKSGLVAGSYNVIIKSIGGCSSVVSSATINALPTTPATPIVGTVTQPNCTLATGSVGLSGLPSGNWTINPGNISGSTTSKTISSLAAGTYNFTVTNSVGCVSVATANVVINSQPNTPIIPVTSVTHPTCSVATGTITVTVQNASDTYSFDSGVSFQASNIKSGLVAGSYNVIIKSIGGCSSVVSSATINALPTTPATPIVGAITQPSCNLATGSVVLSGLPSGNWTINPGNISGSTISTTISGLTAGTYNFTVTNSVGCVSATTANVVINSQPNTPIIPVTSVTQPTCSVATGTITVTVQNASDSYSFDNGVTYQASNIKSGLVAGTYNVIIKSIGGCNSVLKNTIINAVSGCNSIDLKVVETVNTSIAIVGQPVVFTIVATNNGPDNATGSLVTVKLPDGYNFISNTSTIGTYDSSTGIWTIGSLNNGQSETLTITATVNSTGSYVLTSIIQCNEVELTLVNNISTVEILPTDLFIPDGYTPNGDGFNDKFVIKHAASVKIEIEIYNRWGNLVYKNDGYQNDWDGKGTGNFLGKDLPGGTYYCGIKVINISTGVLVSNHLKYITLRR